MTFSLRHAVIAPPPGNLDSMFAIGGPGSGMDLLPLGNQRLFPVQEPVFSAIWTAVISDTKYKRNVGLAKTPHLDAHINLTFENDRFQRCDLHGTIRLVEDANRLWKSIDPDTVGRAIWVYSNKTWRSPSSLKFWLTKGGMTYSSLKSACRELAQAVNEWEYEVGRTGCEVLESDTATAHKITMIGVNG